MSAGAGYWWCPGGECRDDEFQDGAAWESLYYRGDCAAGGGVELFWDVGGGLLSEGSEVVSDEEG